MWESEERTRKSQEYHGTEPGSIKGIERGSGGAKTVVLELFFFLFPSTRGGKYL